ncbi:hypothetical protein Tco_0579729, partial [Tanacetum coccineum]
VEGGDGFWCRLWKWYEGGGGVKAAGGDDVEWIYGGVWRGMAWRWWP